MPPLMVKSTKDKEVGVGSARTPAPSFTKLRLEPEIAPVKLVLELKFIVRVRPVARVKVAAPDSVVPFKDRFPVLIFVVVNAALNASVPP